MNKSPREILPLSPVLIDSTVEAALSEDLGLLGDLTTNATVGANERATAVIASRAHGVISGLDLARCAFHRLDPNVVFECKVADGGAVKPGDVVATISGNARALLTAERVALNYMGRMSGIATLTASYVAKTAGTKARIVDTRKTTPGLRALEKYAVRCGGGDNHRTGLFDAILIKDNHIVAAGGVTPAIEGARAAAGHMVKIEVEVDTLDQLDEVLKSSVDCVLLDNMSPELLKRAVAKVAGRCLTEASGGITLATVATVAKTGVDMISVGALTHSATVLDLGLDFVLASAKTRRTRG